MHLTCLERVLNAYGDFRLCDLCLATIGRSFPGNNFSCEKRLKPNGVRIGFIRLVCFGGRNFLNIGVKIFCSAPLVGFNNSHWHRIITPDTVVIKHDTMANSWNTKGLHFFGLAAHQVFRRAEYDAIRYVLGLRRSLLPEIS